MRYDAFTSLAAPAGQQSFVQTRRASSTLWLTILATSIFGVWAGVFELDEVAVGHGKVTPSNKAQIVQSLDGGIVLDLAVREGDIIAAGQHIATLDPVLARSTVEETTARIRAMSAAAARLEAEIRADPVISFPAEIDGLDAITARERALFDARRKSLNEKLGSVAEMLVLAQRELAITEPLQLKGAASDVEVLRLKQKVLELQAKLDQYRSDYSIAAKEELSKIMLELEPLRKTWDGRADKLRRTNIVSPLRGVVKDVAVATIGGVVAPGGTVMEIVPIEDQLLIEAHLSPRDIAFIRPGLEAVVKLTAYDPAIYGTLPAVVDRVSPDTIEDKTQRGQYYYRIYVRTNDAFLTTRDGKRHPIIPGMIATTEIRTGHKTIMDYLLKPLNKAGEALRER
jgi:membrane fusion protein, adhesin transport system